MGLLVTSTEDRCLNGPGVVLIVLLVTSSTICSQTPKINVFPLGWVTKFIAI